MNMPTNQGLDPRTASFPPAILEVPSFLTNVLSPHVLLAMHLIRKKTLPVDVPSPGQLFFIENVCMPAS